VSGAAIVTRSFGASWRGRRPANEDALGKREPVDAALRGRLGCLYVIADGMGGHQAGEVASAVAVETVLDAYFRADADPSTALRGAVAAANRRVCEAAGSSPEWEGMGSTLVACAIVDGTACVAHVGDSRAYLVRDGRCIRLTRDHLWVIETLALDDAAAARHPRRNVLSRAIGVDEAVEADCVVHPLAPGDRVLLCTDGLTNAVQDDEIHALLLRPTPRAAARRLVALARLRRTRDNASTIAVFVDPPGASSEQAA
jgi:protein phosphatase